MDNSFDNCEGVPQVGNVHWVDSFGANLLFRGSQPLIGGGNDYQFNYQGLRCALRSAAENVGMPMPENYRIIDINLMQCSNSDEIPKILCERDFFSANPDLGDFVWWNTDGTSACPQDANWNGGEAQPYCAGELDLWMGDRLVERTEALYNLLTAPSPPTVIYVHCYGGDDRTGERIGAYYLRYGGKSWEEAYELNTRFAGKPIGCNNYRALMWYAYYLNYTQGFSLDMSVARPCSDPNGPWIACGQQAAAAAKATAGSAVRETSAAG